MKRWSAVLVLLLGSLLPASALDREAFTTVRYRLDVQIGRDSHVMAVSGRLTLRNDSKSPQKFATLQVSSSLAWNGIGTDDKPADCNCIGFAGDHPLQWIGDVYTSDIDHTGALSEAIVTLPKEVAPGASISLDVQYGGTITQESTRLTRMGAPDEIALRNDWDQISNKFTGIRGLGYVTWYPVALDAVSLSNGNEVFDSLARWKNRHQSSEFFAYVGITLNDDKQQPCIAANPANSATWRVAGGMGSEQPSAAQPNPGFPQRYGVTLQAHGLQDVVPAITILPGCDTLARPTVEVISTPEHAELAKDYALAAEANDSLLHDWVGDSSQPARVVELTDPNANPYQDGPVLFTPLRESQTANLQLLLLPTQVAARFHSPRSWIQDGLERFLQAMSVENRVGRKAAIKFLDEYREPLVKAEEEAHPARDATTKNRTVPEADNTLLNTSDELYLRGKGSFVFWMLRDMLGDQELQHALAAYRPVADKEASYFQKLLQSSGKRDLEWFFDDWVYRDRGLPELHVASAYARPLLSESLKTFMVTVTIENRGGAGAEVPVIVETPSGNKIARVIVKAKDKGVGRIELPVAPKHVQVNDGSVPEANLANNVYDLPDPQKP